MYAAALRLFRERGYHATSMQDIAEAVGLYKGSLYHYIGGKEDLLAQVLDRGMGQLLRRIETIVADTALDPAEQLRRTIRAHVCAVAENRDALTVYLNEWRAFEGETMTAVREQRQRYAELVTSIVERGTAAGVFRPTDLGTTTLAILGMCNWLSQWYRPDGRLAPDAIADQFADLVLQGLRV